MLELNLLNLKHSIFVAIFVFGTKCQLNYKPNIGVSQSARSGYIHIYGSDVIIYSFKVFPFLII